MISEGLKSEKQVESDGAGFFLLTPFSTKQKVDSLRFHSRAIPFFCCLAACE